MADHSKEVMEVVPESKQVNEDDMKDKLQEKMMKRHEQRLAKMEKRRTEREQASSKDESIVIFTSNFNSEKKRIQTMIDNSNDIPTENLNSHFDSMTTDIHRFQKYVTDSIIFLPSYDQKHAQDTVNQLNSACYDKRKELKPKKKFTFSKSKKKESKSEDDIDKPPNKMENEKLVQLVEQKKEDSLGFRDCSSQDLEMLSDKINTNDIGLSELVDCKVVLKGSPSAVHIDKLTRCKVFCGPVSGSIFIADCTDCTFIMSCQQLRVHTTTSCSFYLHVTSRAIIEDSTKVVFAPYDWTYDEIEKDFALSGLDRSKNSWDDVDDFNWLASDKHSPNWSILPEESRIKY
ncbi:tubulin-specific chaperone C-like isoform X3 [Anneissia japonica]|uniref:tubulin-specific chaperone C-like isoform X1 n=1 Tax=Anneissia japonica TaxID=1529436 RepID=UPI001425B68F|nr:tubulin-specific chaperone C-like isoform X1 [Anneissia japonica]XP_033119573.1 tubulin-specific chaperone C-like isoform X2 [Anneissia japonica]XP_033119574.1 tubulin-specific chaperone C-like isoform X3 [Anneissia japonica]